MFCVEETFFDGHIFIIFFKRKEERRIMKTKKKVLIGLMALCLAGTVGAAFATAGLVHQGAEQTYSSHTDKAIQLDWDAGSKASIEGINQLAAGENDYRSLQVVLTKTASLTGSARVTLTLTPAVTGAETRTPTLSGLTVKAYETANKEDVTVQNYTFNEEGKTPELSVVGGASTATGYFDITLDNNSSMTKSYLLVFAFSTPTMSNTNVFSGSLQLALSYVA